MTTLETDAAYALWAEHYPPAPHNALMEVEQQAVIALLPRTANLTVVDVGCGTGRYLRLLSQHGARRVYGVDRSRAMLAHVRHANVMRADSRALPLAAASVDLVVSGLALNDDADLTTAVGEMARVLKPNGVVVYSALHPRGARAGWSRTFQARGHTWTLPVYWHSLKAHARACARARLVIEQWVEPELPGRRGAVALVIRAARR